MSFAHPESLVVLLPLVILVLIVFVIGCRQGQLVTASNPDILPS
jgi:hypothetical protein